MVDSDFRGTAFVVTNITDLREGPDHDSPLASELLWGSVVEVVEGAGAGHSFDREEGAGRSGCEWVWVREPDGYEGWVVCAALAPGEPAAGDHIVLAPSVALRSAAAPDAPITGRLMTGTIIRVVETREGWCRTDAAGGGLLPQTALRPIHTLATPEAALRETIARDALTLIGVPYRWGGVTGNGIDCSGLVQLLHRWVGVAVRRDAHLQAADVQPATAPWRAGDLFFFGPSGTPRSGSSIGPPSATTGGSLSVPTHGLRSDPADRSTTEPSAAAGMPGHGPWRRSAEFDASRFQADGLAQPDPSQRTSDRSAGAGLRSAVTHVVVGLGGDRVVHSSREHNGVYGDSLSRLVGRYGPPVKVGSLVCGG